MPIRHLDFYCERLGPNFWAEPWNAWSNLGFILVGIWALCRTSRQRKSHSNPQLLFTLSGLLLAVGVGSFLFHTFADNRTHLMDLLPIFLFTMVYIFHSFRNYIGMPWQKASFALVMIIGAMVVIEVKVPKTILNGSLLYIPPLLAAIFVSWKLREKDFKSARLYGAAALVFLLSLVARTLDMAICESFPQGTHFLWHIFNSLFLGILMKVAFEFRYNEPTKNAKSI